MVKRLIYIAAIIAAFAALAPEAHAQGIYAAWWNPRHVDSDGYGGGVRFTGSFSPTLGSDLRVSYINFSNSDASTVPIEGTLFARLGNMYAGVGYGYYFFTGDTDINDDWGWYLLAGMNIIPRPVQVFGEFKWQKLDPDNGGDLESYVFHLGVMLGR